MPKGRHGVVAMMLYWMLDPMLVYLVVRLVPAEFTAVTMATAMAAEIRAYSIAVVPCSSFKK
jgi:hypothetical protein